MPEIVLALAQGGPTLILAVFIWLLYTRKLRPEGDCIESLAQAERAAKRVEERLLAELERSHQDVQEWRDLALRAEGTLGTAVGVANKAVQGVIP